MKVCTQCGQCKPLVDFNRRKASRDGLSACCKKLLAKKPEVKIEVYTELNENNGKEYARAEFKDRSVAMPHGDEQNKNNKTEDPLADAKDVSEEISTEDFPF